MNKLFTVSIVALGLGLGLMGCDLLGPADADEVSITLGAIPAITSVSNQIVTGNVDANVEITSITPVIKDASGNTVITITTTKNNVTGTQKKIDLKTDLALTLVVGAQTCNGTYTLELTAVAGSASTSKPVTFTVSGVKDCNQVIQPTLAQTEVTMGSWKSTANGSSLEADELKVYKGAELTDALRAEIDVWFSNTADGHAWLWSPKKAAAASYTPKDWAVQNETKFVEITGSVTFESITTQAQIDAQWNASSAKEFVDIVAGDLVVVKTNKGANRLLKIV
ncbi:MAG TPA: hypothetical protein VHO70_22265, partial [Chitinispirillaceae bacterium]|nr:hypothetical protein [Chitinispirillaceae bacterium]